MNYARIRHNDIANGEGVRTTLFVQGCQIKCPGCQNYEIQSYDGGNLYTGTQQLEIENSIHAGISGLSVLGGEPLSPKNVHMVRAIIKSFKEKHPDKTVWLWTGYELDLSLKSEEYVGSDFHDRPRFNNLELLEYVDVLVDGRWEVENYVPKLRWAGSTNQRVIDIKKTLSQKEIVLYTK